MIQELGSKLVSSLQNQFLAGGLGLMAMGWLGYLARSVPTKLWNLFLRHMTVIVDVQSTDEAYHWLILWLESQPYSKRARRISIRDVRTESGDTAQILIPARGEHWFFFKGRPLWLERNLINGDDGAGSGPSQSSMRAMKEVISLRIVGRNRALINGIVAEAKARYQAASNDMLKTYRCQYDDWTLVDKPKRPLESVFLPPGAQDLVTDARAFLDMKPWYRALGIPFRRGYLFFGPPGTGKSCTAEALASILDLPLYVMNLGGKSDSQFNESMGNIRASLTTHVLLIEDIDTVPLTRNTEGEKEQKLSLGTVLNSLDGVHAHDGRILILTSNSPERLDPALLRAGRIDRQVEFGLASPAQVLEAVERFLGPNVSDADRHQVAAWDHPLAMCEIQERLKQMVLAGPALKKKETSNVKS